MDYFISPNLSTEVCGGVAIKGTSLPLPNMGTATPETKLRLEI